MIAFEAKKISPSLGSKPATHAPRGGSVGALDHSSTASDYWYGSKFLKLILADFHDDDEVKHILGYRFYELGRVEASH